MHYLKKSIAFPSTNLIFLGKLVSEKWKHIKDAFVMSLKRKSGEKRKKKYIYSDHLQFLLKVVQKDVTESSICEDAESGSEDLLSDTAKSTSDHQPGTSFFATQKRRKQSSQYDETDKALLKALEATFQPSPPPNEDAAFFASITPTVNNFTEDEKLEFRMGVLTLIKNIKAQRMVMYGTSLTTYNTTPSSLTVSSTPSGEYPQSDSYAADSQLVQI